MGELHKLHLGCGPLYYWPGFTNHDDEIDLLNMPYGDESVSEIHSIHLFEHLPRMDIHLYLKEWHRILVPHGTLVMEMPSLDKMAQLIVKGETNLILTLLGIFGDPRDWKERPLMRHEWAWTNDELENVLTDNGFEVEFKEPLFHIKERDLRVEARK